MPELPEVETVRRVLEKDLLNLTITDVEVRYAPIIENDVASFKEHVIGKKIIKMSRLGKYLIFNLNEGNILSHLRMEGKYFYTDDLGILNKHVHVIYHLSNDYYLMYQDVRKFGRMEYKTDVDLYTTLPLSKLGVEPITEEVIDYKKIYAKIKNSHLPIKTLLLDQTIILGFGNIYVDEVLFKAHINPFKKGYRITMKNIQDIMAEGRIILNKAIELKGTTIRSYTSSLGVEGAFQNFLCVHTKEICPLCGKTLKIDKIGGRSTYYCEVCQK